MEPALHPDEVAVDQPYEQQVLKRAFDLVIAGIAFVALLPLLVAIGIAVRVGSSGSILYRGVRAGRHGRPFRIFKFRTMRRDAELCGGTTTGLNDARVTRVGRFLRDYKLDELPQLLNVLWGDMSLVGPRPEVFEYVDAYTTEERLILTVRPGITDLASIEFVDLAQQVGHRDPDETFRRCVLPRKNTLRLKYVREQSFALDLSILGSTVCRLFQKAVGSQVREC